MDRETEELLCGVQAQLFAQRIALRTLARTNPDPMGLLKEWREALVGAATSTTALPAPARNSDYLAEQVRAFSEDFTAELVELAVPAPAYCRSDNTQRGTDDAPPGQPLRSFCALAVAADCGSSLCHATLVAPRTQRS